jgi:DNA-binding transcriptional ArsR family regulator
MKNIKKLNCCCEKDLENLNDFLRIIADKNRLRILCCLHCGERCVCEIYEDLDLPQNLTSHHLKALEKGNCVSYEKRGQKVFYKLKREELKTNLVFLNKLLS